MLYIDAGSPLKTYKNPNDMVRIVIFVDTREAISVWQSRGDAAKRMGKK